MNARAWMKNSLIIVGFSLGVLLFRLFSTPLFDPPDEQSHYAQIHFFVDQGRMPNLHDQASLSDEEMFVERVIGTMSNGENKYFFHPEYAYEQNSSTIGKFEAEIWAHNTKEFRSQYTYWQSSTYPPLYYWFGSLFYRLVDARDFFARLFAVRFASVLITTLVPIVAYVLARNVWHREYLARIFAGIVFFFPMTTYLGAGINSDTLHTLFFALGFVLLMGMVQHGFTSQLAFLLGTTIGLDLLTKPQAYVFFPLLILALGIRAKWEIRTWFKHSLAFALPILLLAGWQEIPKFIYGASNLGTTAYTARQVNYGGWENFQIYLRYYLRTHSQEIVVWYWGVFKWSGVILPKIFWWVANRLVLISGLGIVYRLVKDVRAHSLSLISRFHLLALSANLTYILAIAFFDWQFYQEYGHSLGLQARYYLPLLVAQMFLFVSGLFELSVAWPRLQKIVVLTVGVFFLCMHIASVYALLASYFPTSDFMTFFTHLSQYRPPLGKGAWWYLWTAGYIASIIGWIIWVSQAASKSHEK